jgi:regulatory protein
LLARRAHSRLELSQKLRRRGYDPEEVEGAIERLAERGYVDDAAFARGLVRRRSTVRGPLALAGELSARGIDRAGIAAALEGVDPEAELAAATHLAERLYAERPLPGYREVLDRVGSKLMRRGFSAGVVRAACRAVLAGAGSGPEA